MWLEEIEQGWEVGNKSIMKAFGFYVKEMGMGSHCRAESEKWNDMTDV